MPMTPLCAAIRASASTAAHDPERRRLAIRVVAVGACGTGGASAADPFEAR